MMMMVLYEEEREEEDARSQELDTHSHCFRQADRSFLCTAILAFFCINKFKLSPLVVLFLDRVKVVHGRMLVLPV